jgi:hypothetical protein
MSTANCASQSLTGWELYGWWLALVVVGIAIVWAYRRYRKCVVHDAEVADTFRCEVDQGDDVDAGG